MRYFLLCFLMLCLVGCGAAPTCKECGDSAIVDDDQFCNKCALYFADVPDVQKPSNLFEGWERDFQAARVRASSKNKSILLLFTGSDWCATCQSLRNNVLDSAEFKSKIANEVVLVVCDNPRNESLTSSAEKSQYMKLSARFKVAGVPTVFLIGDDNLPYYKLVGYGGTPASEWVSDFQQKIQLKKELSER